MTYGLAAFILRKWQLVVLMTSLLIVLGVTAFSNIARTEDPQIDGPLFYINAVLPGATPSEVEQLVTKPIEDALYGLSSVRQVRSQSSGSLSATYVEFEWDTDAERTNDAIERELNKLRATLPSELARLDVVRGRPTSAVIAEVALVSDIMPMRRLEKLAERLRERIGGISGINEAKYWGVTSSEMRVSLNAQKLSAIGVAPIEVTQALRRRGGEGPVGEVQGSQRRFNVRYGGAYPDAQSVRDTPVVSQDGGVLRVGDVADVDWQLDSPDHVTRYNGRRAVLITATQNVSANVLPITYELSRTLDQFERTLPGGVSLVRPFFQADNLNHRLDKLSRDFGIALLLVCITLLPLGIRAALLVMAAIPLSLLFGVILLQLSGSSLNQLSIAGFVLALGILVDDAIVVTENIVRWMRAEADRTRAVVQGVGQITLAVIGCTACLIFAFLPLLALPEASGEFVRSLPIAVLATMAGSLVISLSVIPPLARRFLKKEEQPEGNWLLRALNNGIHRFYAPSLKRALNRPKTALAALLGVTLLTVPLLLIIGTSLFPPADTPQFLVRVETQQGGTFDRTDKVVGFIEHKFEQQPEVDWVIGNIGRGNPPIYYNQPQRQNDPGFGEIVVGMKTSDAGQQAKLIDRLMADLSKLTGVKISVVRFVQGPVLEAPIVLQISGPDIEMLAKLASKAEAALQQTEGLRDVSNPLRSSRIDLTLTADETAVAALGVPAGALKETLRLGLSGVAVANLRDQDGDDYPVKVRLPMNRHNDFTALDAIYLPTDSGQSVPLKAVASPSLSSGPTRIDRLSRTRFVGLTANVASGVLVSRATKQAEANVRKAVELPAGYTISLGGEAESQARSFAGLLPALMIATFGILTVLVLEFGQFRMVAVVVGIVPFGLFGAVVALWLTNNSLSFTASIGLIALIGIEIKNSILLVDFAEQMRRQGNTIREAVERAGELRFLPVVLTSVTAIGGLLPLAWENSGLYAPMAIVMIGGLIASTLLARIATPVMYLLLAREAANEGAPQ